MELSKAVELCILNTYKKAFKHPPFVNIRDAHGCLLEEVAEFFDCIREKEPDKAHCVEELQDIISVCMKWMSHVRGCVNMVPEGTIADIYNVVIDDCECPAEFKTYHEVYSYIVLAERRIDYDKENFADIAAVCIKALIQLHTEENIEKPVLRCGIMGLEGVE